MTPMIDIIFQLIAFFMVINNFEQSQVDERVKLPKDQLARPREKKAEDNYVLNIGFERNKQGEITGGPYVFYDGKQIPVNEFNAVIEREKKVMAIAEREFTELTVEIRADGHLKTGQIQEVIQMAQEVGFQKFTLKATQSDE